jgi:AAA domain-containing protein/primase-like protein
MKNSGKIYGAMHMHHKQQPPAPSNVASEPVVPDPVKDLGTNGDAGQQDADQQQRINGNGGAQGEHEARSSGRDEKAVRAHEDAALPKPQTYNGDITKLPPALEHLRDQKVWVNWCWFWNGKKWTKPPRRVDDPSRNASTSDPTTWGTYEQAVTQVRAGNADGIGFTLKGRDIGGTDLDHCRDPATGQIEPWADNYVRRFPGAYVEATVSGKGLRVLGASALQSFAPKFKLNNGNGAAIELFSNSHHYLTLSCNALAACSSLPPIGETMAAIAAELGAPPKQDRMDFDAAPRVDDAPHIAPDDDAAAPDAPQAPATPWSFAEETRLRSALAAIPTDEAVLAEKLGHSHDTWVKIGRAIERLDWGERGYAIWRDWSAQNAAEFNEKGLRTQWASFNRNRNAREKPTTIATVYLYAIKCGWRFRSDDIGAGGGFTADDDAHGERAKFEDIDPSAVFTFLGDAPASAPRELIKKLIPAYGIAVTGGQPSAGKTFIEMHKAVCLAKGLPFFGHKITERVGTIFVAAEGRALIPNRFAAALAKASIVERLPIAWIKELPDFSSADGIRLFVRRLKALDERFQGDFGARLGQVVIDTVAASFGMKDEDDNAEATKVCNVMRTIGEQTGALMAPVHHYGKNPESGLRGASAWKGSADLVQGVLADIDPLTGRASNRELVCAKARDGEQGPIAPFALEFVALGLDPDGEVYGSCCVIPADGQSRFDKPAGQTKSQRAIRDAIAEAIDSCGKTIVPRAGMPSVKAAKVADVRAEFERRYAVAEADPAKAAHAKYMAFKRALDRLSPSQFAAGAAEGADWIWMIT